MLWKCGVCISVAKMGVCVVEMGYVLWKWGVCVVEMWGMYISCKNGRMCCGNVGYVSVAEMEVCVVEMWGMYQLQKWGVCIAERGGMCYGNGGYVSVAEMGVCVVEMGGMCCGNVGYVYQLQKWGSVL